MREFTVMRMKVYIFETGNDNVFLSRTTEASKIKASLWYDCSYSILFRNNFAQYGDST